MVKGFDAEAHIINRILRLLQKSVFVIPEVFIGNPVFFFASANQTSLKNQRLLDTRSLLTACRDKLRRYDDNRDSLDTFARAHFKKYLRFDFSGLAEVF